MYINWKVRFSNKEFVLLFIATIALLIQRMAAMFGVTLDLSPAAEQLGLVIESVFALLALLGVAVDPTTDGIGDSRRALTYTKPHKD
jgi:phi LC3 family holin